MTVSPIPLPLNATLIDGGSLSYTDELRYHCSECHVHWGRTITKCVDKRYSPEMRCPKCGHWRAPAVSIQHRALALEPYPEGAPIMTSEAYHKLYAEVLMKIRLQHHKQ